MLKKNQCTWILSPSKYDINAPRGEQFVAATLCGAVKNAKAKNPNYANEDTQYESFCPKHMAEFTRIRKEKHARDEDDEFFV